jgi:CRP-like cAMP-binding protein
MVENLIQFINTRTRLTVADDVLIRQYFEPVLFPKNRVIEEEGYIPRYLYYIVSGYLRLFRYNDSGEEATTHINCPPGFFTAYTSFIEQRRSPENVECITDCELLRITKADLDNLTAASPAIKDFSIGVFQQTLAYNEGRSRDLATLSAEQRYRKLLAEHPDVLYHVPIAHIASFLGMKPESLSRIRKKLASHPGSLDKID